MPLLILQLSFQWPFCTEVRRFFTSKAATSLTFLLFRVSRLGTGALGALGAWSGGRGVRSGGPGGGRGDLRGERGGECRGDRGLRGARARRCASFSQPSCDASVGLVEAFQLCSCQEFRVPKSILKNLKATSCNLKARLLTRFLCISLSQVVHFPSSKGHLFTISSPLSCVSLLKEFVSCRPSGNSLWDRQLVTILSFLWTFWSSLISRLVTDEVAQAWGATCQRSFRGFETSMQRRCWKLWSHCFTSFDKSQETFNMFQHSKNRKERKHLESRQSISVCAKPPKPDNLS